MLIVRGQAAADTLMSSVREAVRRLDPDLPLYRTMTMRQAISDARWGSTQSMWISYTLIGIAFALAIVGLYAVTAHAVAQRQRELGVRIALGAGSRQIVGLVLSGMLKQLTIGLAAGVVFTFLWERPFSTAPSPPGPGALFRTTDPLVLLASATLIVAVALLACASLSYRATRLDPVTALRQD